MKRRDFLRGVAVGVPALSVTAEGQTFGAVTVDRSAHLREHGIYLRVYQNGEDVTDRCRFFDDTPGKKVAELYVIDPLTGDLNGETEEVSDFAVRLERRP